MVSDFEISIKQFLIQLHKDAFGMGPRSLHVRTVRDVVIVRSSGCLTQLEKTLLKEKGANYVRVLRRNIVVAFVEHLKEKAIFMSEIVDYHMTMSPELDVMHCIFFLRDDLESMIYPKQLKA